MRSARVALAWGITIACVAASSGAAAERSFCGIGVQLKPQDDAVIVEKVFPGGGASQGGVPAGSRLVSIDGKPVK